MRGGRREGAGRKAGVPTVKTVQRRRVVAKAIEAAGQDPLDVMLANMRHFNKLAESAESALAEFSADKISGLPPDEQFKYLLAEVKKAAGLRHMAQECARDASPYVHPRLSAISAPDGGPIKVETIKRLVIDPNHHHTDS